MKFSIKDFVVRGMIGGAYVGMNRAEVRACLGEPDDWMEPNKGPRVVERALIWRYGNFEVHFFLDDSVSLLFLDHLAQPEAGDGRELEVWMLAGLTDHSLAGVRSALEGRGVEFDALDDRRGAPVLRVKGGADLTFNDAEGAWLWGSIVVDAATVLADQPDEGWDKVYTVPDWYDGPRRGIANFEGEPHLFESEFADIEDADDVFVLSPVSDETFRLALEKWQIWRRWERAFHAGETPMDTHPALPEDRKRWEELQRLLIDAGVVYPERHGDGPPQPTTDLGKAVRATAAFRSSGTDNGHASLLVKWKRL
jgi:hypothetical protein